MRHAPARILASLMALVMLPAPLPAQETDPQSLVNELRRELATAREQLADARLRITQLEAERAEILAQLDAARQALRAVGAPQATPAGPAEARAHVPADPFASPDSMLNELRRRYEVEFGQPAETPEAMGRRSRDVDAWCRQVTRDLRRRTSWLVEFTQFTQIDARRHEATLRIIDEPTGLPIGDPVRIEVGRTIVERVERAGDQFRRWRAQVVIEAAPRHNPDRTERGVFDTPPLIGPYADFGITIDLREVHGVREDRREAPAQPGSSPAQR